MFTRRDLLKMSLLSGVSLCSLKYWPEQVLAQMGGGGSPSVTPFQVPLPIPPTLSPTSSDTNTDYYTIIMQQGQKTIIPGTTTTIWGYNGIFPGPTIKARSGHRVVVRQINNLGENTVVHLHGGHLPADADGYPMDYIVPGSYKDYVYPNNQVATTLWYHDHTMDKTAQHVYKGLAGFYIISDDVEDSLPLPKENNDVALVIQDRSFNSNGSLNYPTSGMGGMGMMGGGFMGDTILVNGAVQPYFVVGNRKIRFRILNGSNARSYQLALSTGKPFVQIGTDGGLLPAPVNRSSITIYPAERVDIIIDFSLYPIGTQVILKNNAGSGRTANIMRFDVLRPEADESTILSTLRPIERIDESLAVTTRTFTLSSTMMGGNWLINGQTFNPSIVNFTPKLGTVEIWKFVNSSNMVHPMHMHDVMFQVLDVNGVSVTPGSAYYGWKDTVQVPANGQLRTIVKFVDYLGLYVSHCHILEHEDLGMMNQFQVVP